MEHFSQINEFLADSAFFYTIAIGMDSRYTYVSANYNRNFDHSNGSLLGKHFSVTLHPEDIAICETVGGQCFARPGELLPATLRKHDGQGGYVVTQWEIKAFFDGTGQPAGIFCIGYNITEYVDTRSRLENVTTQLSEIGFMQSHLVRKPLANIMGLAGILGEIAISPEHQSINDKLIASAQELDQVIRDISEKTN